MQILWNAKIATWFSFKEILVSKLKLYKTFNGDQKWLMYSHASSLTHLADKVQTVVSIVLEKRFLAFEYREWCTQAVWTLSIAARVTVWTPDPGGATIDSTEGGPSSSFKFSKAHFYIHCSAQQHTVLNQDFLSKTSSKFWFQTCGLSWPQWPKMTSVTSNDLKLATYHQSRVFGQTMVVWHRLSKQDWIFSTIHNLVALCCKEVSCCCKITF